VIANIQWHGVGIKSMENRWLSNEIERRFMGGLMRRAISQQVVFVVDKNEDCGPKFGNDLATPEPIKNSAWFALDPCLFVTMS
jgi:hypothetical protein